MKILAAGDFHGDVKQIEKLAEQAVRENVDLVILNGDITQGDVLVNNLIKPFTERKKKVLLIPGNHESFATADFLAEIYNVKNIHGYSVRYEDVGIFGCGGANIGIHQIDENEIEKLLEESFKGISYLPKKIMVTHVHPSNSIMEKFSKFVPGSRGVREAIEKLQPDILICGHVHEAEGLEEKIGKTKVINVGRKGKIIEL